MSCYRYVLLVSQSEANEEELYLQSSQFSYNRLPDLLVDGDLNIPKPNQLLNSTEAGAFLLY